MTPSDRFNELLIIARADPNILAFLLLGSRGKGLSTEHSDYDCTLIVKDEAVNAYRAQSEELNREGFDLSVTTLTEFAEYAAWGSATAWDRYNFAHTKALVDKLGIVQKMIDEKGAVPASERGPFIRRSLDHYINQVYRSLKCHRDGDMVASRLEAAEGINPLLDAIFARMEGCGHITSTLSGS